MKISRPIIAAGTLALMASLSACSPSNNANPATETAESAAKTALTVKASFYPLKYLTEQIGGDRVAVESLTPDGAEPHDLELSPAALDSLARADAVVYLKGFQPAVDEAIEQSSPKNVIDVSTAVQLVDVEEAGNHATEEEEHEGEAHEEAAHDDHAHEGEEAHAHDHGTTDPHFWLDPERMAQAATVIGQALATADPDNAQEYTANAASTAKSMKDLSTELVTATSSCELTTFVTAHSAFGYLADRTGLTQVGIAGIDPESSPSPARLKEIEEVIAKEKVTTIFTETLVDPKVEETLARDLKVSTAVLDPIESQSDPSKDYAAVMRDNITALKTALKCK